MQNLAIQNLAMSCLWVATGGALGALARYGLNLALHADAGYPWGTLSANLLGCLAMGVIAQFLTNALSPGESWSMPEHYRLLFAVGFCGSFTTLSSFVIEISAMLQRNEIVLSFTYFVATLAGGFACFYLGLALTRSLLSLLTRGST
jgi:fluoride exporter